jgi:hypothetical protein
LLFLVYFFCNACSRNVICSRFVSRDEQLLSFYLGTFVAYFIACFVLIKLIDISRIGKSITKLSVMIQLTHQNYITQGVTRLFVHCEILWESKEDGL